MPKVLKLSTFIMSIAMGTALTLLALIVFSKLAHANQVCGYVNGQYVCINQGLGGYSSGNINGIQWRHQNQGFGTGSGSVDGQRYRSRDLGFGSTEYQYDNGKRYVCRQTGFGQTQCN